MESLPDGPWRSYKEKVATLAQRVVEAQRPIRVLNALVWPADVAERFFARRCKELPEVTRDHYQAIPLGFDPASKTEEFREIERDATRELGSDDAIGAMLCATANEYARVAEMLEARGTPRFYELGRELYGSTKDALAGGRRSVREFAVEMYQLLTNLDEDHLGEMPRRDIPAERAVTLLNERLATYFGDGVVRVILDDGIVADAAAGSDYVKLRQGALFSASATSAYWRCTRAGRT